jgi:hypothetical protein
MSHYKWLDVNLKQFFANVGIDMERGNGGIISAHGDKGYSYRDEWERAGIPFEHGMAIFLLSYITPFANEVRDTPGGWVPPVKWVLANYRGGHKFIEKLPDGQA